MKPTFYQRSLLLFFIACFPLLCIAASSESYIQTLSGKIKPGDSCLVVDDKFMHLPLSDWNRIRNLSVDNIITFELRQDTSVYYFSRSFTCTVNVTIKYYTSRDQRSPQEISNIDLVVKYDTATGAYYPVHAEYKFRNAFKVVVVVNTITSEELGEELPALFRIKNQILVERKYPFSSRVNASMQLGQQEANSASGVHARNVAVQPAGRQLMITWNPGDFPGSEAYDVEWTFIDVLGVRGQAIVSTYTSGGVVDIPDNILEGWMRHDNTRVTISGPPYTIDLPYTDGYVAVRMRGVAYDPDTDLRLTTQWVYRDGGNRTAIAPVAAQEPNLNWQFTAVFSEEGKRKEVISYFDGSLRSRQSVTISNSDNKAIVQESIYDQMGRPALNILPAPVNDNALKYYGALSRNPAGSPYSHADINLSVAEGNNSCRIGAAPLHGGGAAAYYSSANPFLNDPNYYFNHYVPDAGGYPYSLTEYTPDNTGRIRRQGGVGTAFQIGNGHETKYFYGKPSQEELDRLFGMEAGNMSHYLKNMVVDPNGQISISYIDAGGKTIATALAGGSPPMTDALPSSRNAESRVRLNQPLVRSADFKRNGGEIMMQASATFLAAVTGTFKVHYTVNPASLTTLPSQGRGFCNSCYYDILVEVRDDCGDIIADTVAAPFPINAFMCHDFDPPVQNSLSVPVLKVGEYTVTYTLRLSNAGINVQTDFYIQNNTDLKTIQHFFEDELQKIDLSGCYSDCFSCEAKLGSQEVFAADMYALLEKVRDEKYANYPQLNLQSPLIQGWITSTYSNLLNDCRARAATCVSASPCDQFLQMMRMDVMPGGQYALFNYDSASNTYTYVDRNVNVLRFYNVNQPDNTELYNFSYADENSNTVFIRDLSESDFIRAYTQHPEWADMFVKKHIEYCSYLWCKDHNEASYAFDQALRDDILTGEQASTRGYYNRSNYRALLDADPFFASGGRGAAYAGQMEQDLLNLSTVLKITPKDGGQNPLPVKNIVQLVDWLLYCNPAENSPAHVYHDSWLNCSVDQSCRSLTREWELYRNYYLKIKSRYVRLAKLAYNPDCTDCFIGQDVVAHGGCLTPNMGDFMIRDEAIGRDGIRFFFVYKEGSLPIPDHYVLQYSINIRGNITYHTATSTKGEPRLVLFEYTNTPAGIPTLTLLSVTCKNTSNSTVAGCNPTSGGGEVGPCPASWEFTTEVRRFRKVQHEPCPVFEWDEYVVRGAGPVTRRVHVKVLHYRLIRPEPYEEIVTFEPGESEYFLGTFQQSNGGVEGCWDEDHNFGISEEPPVCEEVITYPPSTCRDDSRYELYANKSRVFNDFIAEDGYASCIAGDGTIPQTDTLYTELRQQELVNLEALRSNWMDRLRAVVAEENELDRQRGMTPLFLAYEDLHNGTTVNPKLVQLVDNLYLVARKSIEVARKENIRAASTLPPGVVADNGYDSFESVFRAFVGDALMQQGFNQYLLEKPYPYNKSTITANPSGGDLNAPVCTNMAALRNRYSASGFGGTFHEYLKQELEDDYVLTAQELSDMESRCNRGCRYLDKPVLFPVAFVTPFPNNPDHPFVDCNRVHDLKAQFEAAHPGLQGDTTKLYRVLLGNYLNHRLGYALSYSDYNVFLTEKCPSQGWNAVLYNKAESPLIPNDDFACAANIIRPVYDRAAEEYERYIAIERRLFRNRYIAKCLSTGADAKIEGDQYEYHHTLYYYDQSGNLVKTIPPEGVRMLDGEEMKKVDMLRQADPSLCDGYEMPTYEDRVETFSAFSTALQTGEARSLELWLNNSTVPTRQVRFITPDNNYLFQTAISDNKLWAELYLTNGGNPTLLNRAVADISSTVMLEWSHLVIQSQSFSSAPWDIYLDGRKLTLLPAGNAPPYPFPSGQTDEIADLKQFRLYNRPMTQSEITENFRNSCLLLAGTLGHPNLVWGRFNIPSPCSYTGETVMVPNRGALQINANFNQSTRFFENVVNTFTVELWVNTTAPHEIDAESQTSIDGVWNQNYVIGPYWGGYASTGNAGMGISVGTNGVSVYEHADNYMPPLLVWQGPVHGWTHIAVVYQDRTPSLYINGQFVRTGLTSPKQNVSPSYNFGSGYGVMMGQMDEVRIWNTARTPAEIQANFRDGLLPSKSPGLVGYWPVSPEDGANLRNIACGNADVPLEHGNFTWQMTGASLMDQVIVEAAKRFLVPLHGMPTRYLYNSQEQVVKQTTPDAGVSEFWYDRLGRLAISQNAEQKAPLAGGNPNRYSYTKYDALGRITEVGEKVLATGPVTEENVRNEGFLSAFHGSGSNQQVTVTAYDEAPSWAPPGLVLRNLRKRVVASAALYAGSDPAVNRFAASYYSYDIGGSVEELIQENADLGRMEKENVPATDGLKRIRYEYDHVSGKTNKVLYQDGKWDQFFYQYLYDADNRVIKALSSRVNYADLDLWVTEATYRYYLHGPLARVELGKNKVQGIDYAYTLQGWMKGVNGQLTVGQAFRDMAHDGFDDPGYYFKHVARDVYNFSLGYFGGDYLPVGNGATAFGIRYQAPVTPAPGQPQTPDTGKELFNGNISNSTVTLRPFESGSVAGYSYRYDQLHRITGMRRHMIGMGATAWNNASIVNAYQEEYAYDGNGNIQSVLRNGSGGGGAPMEMDAAQYVYETDANQRLLNNKLRHITDGVAASNYANDIDTQDAPNLPNENYRYNAIGNLISDRQEKINSISWTVYGKISNIYKADLTDSGSGQTGTTTSSVFRYDASGNRIQKSVTTQVYSQAPPPPVVNTTFYVRDAQGNVLGVYTYSNQTGGGGSGNGLTWSEQHLYGSARLGVMNTVVAMPAGPQPSDAYTPNGDPASNGIEGKRVYELTNHLDNVLAAVSDRRLGVDENNDGTIDYYNAELLSATDYYPFGMVMPGRSYNAGGYRYGFNGKENDNEMKGEGNMLDYGMRIYDPRVGRFLSVDPLTKSYPYYTPYQYAGNKPVKFIDLDGLEEIDPIQVIQAPKSNGEPGLAHTTARKVYFVVTAGAGALSEPERTSINVAAINAQLNSTPNEPATMNPDDLQLSYFMFSDKVWNNFKGSNPKRKQEAINTFTAPFTEVTVEFDLNVLVKPDMTLQECLLMVHANPDKYGVILNSIPDGETAALNLPGSVADLIKDANSQFKKYSSTEEEAEAYGSIRSPKNRAGIDLIILNSGLTAARTLTMDATIVHEFGHNATNNVHNKAYRYNQDGLQSKFQNKMKPNRKNKIDVISGSRQNKIYDKIVRPSNKT